MSKLRLDEVILWHVDCAITSKPVMAEPLLQLFTMTNLRWDDDREKNLLARGYS